MRVWSKTQTAFRFEAVTQGLLGNGRGTDKTKDSENIIVTEYNDQRKNMKRNGLRDVLPI